MVSNLDLSTLIAQIPEAQRLQHPQLVSPEVQQALAQELAQRRQRRETKQVNKSESSAENTSINPDDRRHNAPQEHGHKKSSQKTESPFEPDQGRIIDTQV